MFRGGHGMCWWHVGVGEIDRMDERPTGGLPVGPYVAGSSKLAVRGWGYRMRSARE